MKIIFLGTTAAVPTSKRGHTSIALKYRDEVILWDCGEGTQRQMIQKKLSYMKVTKIFITHLHGDHFLGLPGLIQTLSFSGRERPLQIYGPPGIKEIAEDLAGIGNFELNFNIQAKEYQKDGITTEHYKITPIEVEHSVPTYGLMFEELKGKKFLREKAQELGLEPGPEYSKLQRGKQVTVDGKTIAPSDVLGEQKKGIKIIYSSDTLPSKNIEEQCKDAILIHDSTFDETLREKAKESMHSTSVDAAHIAKEGGAKKLFLTHISPRYKETEILYEQAKEIFEDVTVPEDLEEFEL